VHRVKVEVAVFTYRGWASTSRRAINQMAFYAHKAGVGIVGPVEYGNALIHRARNEVLAHIPPDVSHVLMVDDDMVPEAAALTRLLDHDLPVVSALCTTRLEPPVLAVKAYHEESGQFVPMAAMKPKLHTGKFGVGAAFLLLRRDAIDAMIEDYLSAADWLEDHRRLMDRLHVRNELRRKEQQRRAGVRRARMASEKWLRVFDFPVGDDDLQYGEDIGMSRRLIRLGIPIAIDATVEVGHLGEKMFTPDDVAFGKDLVA